MDKLSLEKISQSDGRYKSDGVKFVYEGLAYTVRKIKQEPGHISGQDLSHGLRKMALEKWGRLAKVVLNGYGIKTTRDFGEIVYLLIDNGWLSAQPNDTIDDFNDVFDFQKEFIDNFQFTSKA